jgi:mRNA interferase MazF
VPPSETWNVVSLLTGDVVWADLGPPRGREQAGRRPAVVVSSNQYLDAVDTLALIVPVTSRDRGWPNHVLLSGNLHLRAPSFAMVEQARTVARERIVGTAGSIDEDCLRQIRFVLRAFLDL